MKTLQELIRPNIRSMQPYSCARDEFQGEASVYLDANENPYDTGINRYPDPMQWELKKKIADLKKVSPNSLFLGNGSDEAIDLLFRAFGEPGRDNAVGIVPSYGMYEVAAATNDIEYRKVPLEEGFSLNAEHLLAATDERTKLLFICSPNNPSGNDLDRGEIIRLLENFQGIVVVDEAYIDFSQRTSFITELDKYKNLVVLQTLSKAWGAAGIRLGMAFASPEIIAIYNKVKYPYNVNVLTQAKALEVVNDGEGMQRKLHVILSERKRLQQKLPLLPCVKKIYPTDANFILTAVTDANSIYHQLVEQGIIVRNRNSVVLCEGCLRITVGTPEENTVLLEALKKL